MNKDQFLQDKSVQRFVEWMIPKVDNRNGFIHQYRNRKSRTDWSCDSVFDAYINYGWGFKCDLPGHGKVSGKSYAESAWVLSEISRGLRQSMDQKDPRNLLSYSRSVLKWGGVTPSNLERLAQMGDAIYDYYRDAIARLEPLTVATSDNFEGLIMNSGFTKIYSLLLDDFVIYDSRVGAALCLLVRDYLEEIEVLEIPATLGFAWKDVRGERNGRREPSKGHYRFRELSGRCHIDNNVRANWLLKDIAHKSKFTSTQSPTRALEAALFMIGYSVKEGPRA